MKLKKSQFKTYFLLTLILFILSFNFILFYIAQKNHSKTENLSTLHISGETPYEEQWIDSPSFITQGSWQSFKQGDETDFEANLDGAHANYILLGDKRTFSDVSGIPLESDWNNVTNPKFPALPDLYEIDEYGCHVSHLWVDPNDPVQAPSIHWERIITMPVNMSDYVITSASVSAVYNASVTTQPGGSGSPSSYYGIDTPMDVYGPYPLPQTGDYDTVRFYILISDLADNETYEIAWYQTVDLGQDDPEIANITDSFMNTEVEEALIFYLTSLFKRNNYQFKITIGMRIKCIDNWNYDRDSWDSLRIKSCNFNFTYEKKMNQFASLKWNNQGSSISNSTNILVTGAILRFKYRIDQDWPTSLSPNSELNIYINNKQLDETIKLSSLPTSFQDAKSNGFDVFSLISKGIDINVSIQILLKDEFLLNRTITISIDDVYLDLSFLRIFEDVFTEPIIFRILFIIAIAVAAGLSGYLYLYYKFLRYPRPVRKVRKYRSTLQKKGDPSTKIISRENALSALYATELGKTGKYAKVKPVQIQAESKPELKT
jgi:hypothetical protein